MKGQPATLLSRLLVAGAAVAALLATLALYTRPDFMVRMADQLWSCF